MAKKNVANQENSNGGNQPQDSSPKNAKSKPKNAEVVSSKETDKASGSDFSPVEFLQESREELSKVVWPSRQQLISESAAVILMVTLVATTIYFVDNLFVWLSRTVF
nr:preprotein translocase subunit SecE [Spirulina subsalsa]